MKTLAAGMAVTAAVFAHLSEEKIVWLVDKQSWSAVAVAFCIIFVLLVIKDLSDQ